MAQTAAERKSAQRRTANSLKNGGPSPIAGMGKAAAMAPSNGSASLADIRNAHRPLQPKQFGTTIGGGSGGVQRTTAVGQSIQRPLSQKGLGKSPNAAGGKVGATMTAPLSGTRNMSSPSPSAPTGMDALRANINKAGYGGSAPSGGNPMNALRHTVRAASMQSSLNANGGNYYGNAHIGPTPAAVPGAAVGGSPGSAAPKKGRKPKGATGPGRTARATAKAKKMFLPKGSKHSGNNAKHLDNATG